MTGSLLRSTAVVGSNTLVSRVLGFVRDVVIAHAFGAGAGADAFFVAFRIPNLLRRLFGEGAFSQAFVPVLAEYRAQRVQAEVRELVAHVLGALGATLLAVTVVGVLAAPLLIGAFAPGFVDQADKYALATRMLRITFPYVMLISLTALAAGILNAYGRFAVPAFTPVLLNISLISAALWLAPRLDRPVVALAWGVLIAGLVQLAFQFPSLHALGMLVRPRWRRGHQGVTRILRLIGPALFGVSVAQINLLIDTLIASFLVTGSISWLYYSDRMVEFPLGVFGIALATVILPGLSRQHARGAPERFAATVDWALRWVAVLAPAAAVGLAVLAAPILSTLFERGAFSAHDVEQAARSLTAYALGLPAFVAVKVLAPGYFARQDTRTPVRVGAIAMVANLVLNLLLVGVLAHAGLALATALSAWLNAGLLLRGLRRDRVLRAAPGWSALALRAVVANCLMVIALWAMLGAFGDWSALDAMGRALRLVALVGTGAAVYAATLFAGGLRARHLAPPADA